MNVSEEKMGMVTSIQRCSMHDGPGIRSTVFVKGCNMNCQWCHNPETISFKQETMYYPEKCIHCGMCNQGCFSGAKVTCGKEMTAREIVDEILIDNDYYEGEGGITVSGGEPCCQPQFTEEILHLSKEAGIHTAIETNLNVPYSVLEKVLLHADLLMCDCKIFDEEKHRKYTGVSNRQILENLKRIAEMNIPVIVRTPVIGGINDNRKEISQIAEMLSGLSNLKYYELLPYHAMGLSKGTVNNTKIRFDTPSKETMHALAECALDYVENVYISSVKYNKKGR